MTHLTKHSDTPRFCLCRIWQPLILLALVAAFVQPLRAGGEGGSETGKGKITGTVVDAETGDGLIGVNVIIEGTMIGAATDLDGKFMIRSVPAGTYSVIVSMIGYAKTLLTDVKVHPDEGTRLEVALKMEILETEDVVVTAEMIRNTEASLLKERQKALAVSDAISAEAISRSGSGDAGEAMKQVTGASVVGGKYVYIRGLGERYSSTHLNGTELPTADPDKKAVQMDLFPASLLDNIVTVKTFTPDKPGNFSGGVVDIGTKSFPERFILSFSASMAANSQASFNDNYLTYPGGSRDWLASDDGTRAIPDELAGAQTEVPSATRSQIEAQRGDPTNAEILDVQSKSFNSVMAPVRGTAPVNQSYGFSVGNQSTLLGRPLGYIAGLTYGRSATFFEDGFTGRYTLGDADAAGLNPELLLNDSRGKEVVTWGGILNIGYKPAQNHELNVNSIYSRGGESEAIAQFGRWPKEYTLNDTTNFFENRVLRYVERQLYSVQGRGEHYLPALLKTRLDWSASFAKSQQDEPDLRFFANMQRRNGADTTYTQRQSRFTDPSRYFRELDENSRTFNLNIAVPFKQWSGRQSTFKFGGTHANTDRTFRERVFSFLPATNYDGNPQIFFDTANMGAVRIDTLDAENNRYRYTFGNVITNRSKLRNNYDGDLAISAAYGMVDLPLNSRLRFIGGVRYEITDLQVLSRDSTQTPGRLEEKDFLPSANLVYSIHDNMNLRAAFTRTLARPTFREIAPFESFEFINGNFFIGNPVLDRTLITNYDLRWEWFMRPGEIFAISGFYKHLKNPIERTIIGGTNGQIQYKNLDDATVLGVEFEFRKGLDIISQTLRNFSLGSNLTLAYSRINIEESELAVRRGVNPSAADWRNLQGQSPYLVNADLLYSSSNGATAFSLNFNMFGRRLSNVSLGGTPDVFERTRHELNLTASQELFRYMTIKVGIRNILNSAYRESYEFKGNEFTYLEYKEGRTFSFGLNYAL